MSMINFIHFCALNNMDAQYTLNIRSRCSKKKKSTRQLYIMYENHKILDNIQTCECQMSNVVLEK
jgi:hypothetical protein